LSDFIIAPFTNTPTTDYQSSYDSLCFLVVGFAGDSFAKILRVRKADNVLQCHFLA